jgi:formiminotetrahydrofolate cyclodeaminase
MTSSEADLNLVSLEVEDFLAQLANDQPAPGGGAAAALAGAMAAALTCMVARLTIGRERYSTTRRQMVDVRDRAEMLQSRLAALVDEDAQAYHGVIIAYSLPKGSGTERDRRASEVQDALRCATEVALEAAEACAELIELAATDAALGNRNAASDAAVAALLADAGLRGALLNVHTNVRHVRDQVFVTAAEARLAQLRNAAEVGLARTLASAEPGDATIG